MITTATEYYQNLFKIQDENAPTLANVLPSSEKIYHIDLETRTIEAPEFLSVSDDHRAETIYFTVDRYFDHIDLATTVCVVQYINAAGEGRVYAVPFYDIETFSGHRGSKNEGDDMPKILVPWCIEGEATKEAGDVQYSVRFYKINEGGKFFQYNLNTLPVTSKVLHGMDVITESEDYNFPASVIEEIFEKIENISRQDLFWLIL